MIRIRDTEDLNIQNINQMPHKSFSFPKLHIRMAEHPDYGNSEPLVFVLGRSIDDFLMKKYGYIRNFRSNQFNVTDVYDEKKVLEYRDYRIKIAERTIKYLDRRFL